MVRYALLLWALFIVEKRRFMDFVVCFLSLACSKVCKFSLGSEHVSRCNRCLVLVLKMFLNSCCGPRKSKGIYCDINVVRTHKNVKFRFQILQWPLLLRHINFDSFCISMSQHKATLKQKFVDTLIALSTFKRFAPLCFQNVLLRRAKQLTRLINQN